NAGNPDSVFEKDEGLDHNDETASLVGGVPVTTNTEDERTKLGPWRRDDPVPAACYISYSYYQFLVISNISSLAEQDFQFLELQGCLHVLRPQILDQFVRQYFLHMHPMLPLLDEGAFWDAYTQRAGCREPRQKISLLLFQAMMFACCSYVPQATLSMLGLKTARAARAVFYRQALLLFNFETESSSITRSQAALLLASWSFSSYDVPRKPNIPWLSIAIQHARDAEAHNYEAFDEKSEDYSLRKRLWWCCIIRDRIFGLGMRRGILITPDHFAVGHHSHLGHHDLVGECHRSLVHDTETKIRLAEILELLVELCIILTDVLQLAFPIEDRLRPGGPHVEVLGQIRSWRSALRRWHDQATVRLPDFSSPPESIKRHGSVVLFSNLVAMYYYSTKVALGHYEILKLATNPKTSVTTPPDFITLKDSHFELQDAALGTTECLEKLIHLRLVRWLPITAVSCTALPLLLHLVGVEKLSSSKAAADSSHSKLMNHRLGILSRAMDTYQLQYEGVDWVTDTISHIIRLARAGSTPSTEQPRIVQDQSSTAIDDGPAWYLRLAFTIDVAFGKGRLPEAQVFLPSCSFRDVILAEIGPSEDYLKGPINSAPEVQQTDDGPQATMRAAPSAQDVKMADKACSTSPEDDSNPGFGAWETKKEAKPADGSEEKLDDDDTDTSLDLRCEQESMSTEYEHHVAQGLEMLAQCGCEGLGGSDLDIALSML
ncbi:hypothetical protein CEP52_017038, partial [Fusarium oligoseptatum]